MAPLRSLDISAPELRLPGQRRIGPRGWRALRVALASCPALTALNAGYQSLITLPVGQLEALDAPSCDLCGDVALSPRLKRLHAPDNGQITSVDALPPTLESLDLSRCCGLASLPPLPASLRELRLSGTRCVPARLPVLPRLEVLDVSDCSGLDALPFDDDTAPMLRELSAANNERLRVAELRHRRLQKLTLGAFAGALPAAAHLPALVSLSLRYHQTLQAIRALPAGLKRLSVTGCPALAELPDTWPSGLERLSFILCAGLRELRLPLPPTLRRFTLAGNSHVTSLGDLGPVLERLTVQGCHGLADVVVPRQLRFLNLGYNVLRPFLPIHGHLDMLEELRLTGCGLTALPAFVSAGTMPRLAILDANSNPSLVIDPEMAPMPHVRRLAVDEGVEVPEGVFPGVV